MAEIVYVRDANGNLVQTTIKDLREDRLEKYFISQKKRMEKLRTKIMDLGLIYDDRIYGKGIHEIIAANLLDSSIGETIVRGVCKGIEVIADEEKKTMQQVIEEILEEDENHLKNI